MLLKFRCLPHCPGLPRYATAGAAGMDIMAAAAVLFDPGCIMGVPTGLCVQVPPGHELQIRSRSGLAMKGFVVANSPGTVDEDYRGQIFVILHNISGKTISLARGDRIAQGVLAPVFRAEIVAVDDLDDTPRGGSGFGSTGV